MGRGRGGVLAGGVATVSAVALATTSAWAAGATAGSTGVGDPYYPTYGNGGYDVEQYDISVQYEPRTDALKGQTRVLARTTQALSRFDLDLALPASKVLVNGVPATTSTKNGTELVVTPAQPLRKGVYLTVDVTYAGHPGSVVAGGYAPWVKTADGAVAVGEPQIAAWWFPSSDHPRDKATYDVRVDVPKGVEALSNGFLRSHTSGRTRDVWSWQETKPMASYLAFMAVGQFDITSTTTASGLPVVTAVASHGGSEGTYAKGDLARTGEVIDWHASQWGPYPFDITGGVAPAADFGFALENQTRPVYTRGFWHDGPNIYVIVHEQAHQWYGDSVSVDAWKNIWLNEGFASFAEWRWSETHGDGSAASLFASYYASNPASSSFWTVKIGDPGRDNEFDGAVYDRGAMALQALRTRLGDTDFFQVMRDWPVQHRYSTGTIAQFQDLAEQVSGQDLASFFDHWLYQPTRPAATAENGFPSALQAAAAQRSDRSVAARAPRSRAKIDAVHRELVRQARAAGVAR
ncbi:M1 family metallopeptidase [Angustibacter peucedani]